MRPSGTSRRERTVHDGLEPERLSAPPVITDEMRADMATIGHEFGDHRKTIDYGRLKKLENCGLLEWGERGKCRIVPAL